MALTDIPTPIEIELDARHRAAELIADPGERLVALEALLVDFRADSRYWRGQAAHYYGLWRTDHPKEEER